MWGFILVSIEVVWLSVDIYLSGLELDSLLRLRRKDCLEVTDRGAVNVDSSGCGSDVGMGCLRT